MEEWEVPDLIEIQRQINEMVERATEMTAIIDDETRLRYYYDPEFQVRVNNVCCLVSGLAAPCDAAFDKWQVARILVADDRYRAARFGAASC